MGCRWISATKLPSGLTDYTQLPWGPNVASMPAPRPAPLDEWMDSLVEHITQEIILGGEEGADAVAIVMDVETIQFADAHGHTYALFVAPEWTAMYEYVCGIRAELPWMIGFAALGGIGGFVASRKLSDGGLMGSTLGILAGLGLGAGVGYGVRTLAGR
jgi:hypothetical protein